MPTVCRLETLANIYLQSHAYLVFYLWHGARWKRVSHMVGHTGRIQGTLPLTISRTLISFIR